MEEKNIIYSEPIIGFVKLAVETCLLLEQVENEQKRDFVDKMTKILPLLYLKTSVLPQFSNEVMDSFNERFVTENDYLFVKNRVQNLLGEEDSFLEVFHPDMPYSDTPIAVTISEYLADIYQELKDMATNYRTGNEEIMTIAISDCYESFVEHWGSKLLNTLKALHKVKYSQSDSELEEEISNNQESQTIKQNDFFDFFNED